MEERKEVVTLHSESRFLLDPSLSCVRGGAGMRLGKLTDNLRSLSL